MTHLWDQLEGVYLAGEYGLQQWLGSDPSGAFFLTAYGPDHQRAVVKLISDDPSTATEQLDTWRRTELLSHPSLLPLLDCGRAEAAGDSFLYAVFEFPDDSLAGAIQSGPLNEDEARDVLIAAVDALRYVHAQGMVHTAIDVEHIVAVGDLIKLASDSLRDVRDSEDGYDGDVYALGALVYQLVTAQRIEPEIGPDLSRMSEPLRSIVEHSLQEDPRDRWSLAEIADALNRQSPLSQARVDAVPPTQELEDSPPRTVATEFPPTARKPLPANTDVSSDAPEAPEESIEPVPVARFVPLAAVVVVALVATVWVMVHHSTPVPQSVAIAPPPAPAVTAPPPVAAVVPATKPLVSPARPAVAPSTSRRTPPPAASSPRNWRVIAYTYARYQDAERKVQHINTKYSGLEAEVFSPQGHKQSPFLVALGGHMTREDAQALQRKAMAKGMPRDTFIRNYLN